MTSKSKATRLQMMAATASASFIRSPQPGHLVEQKAADPALSIKPPAYAMALAESRLRGVKNDAAIKPVSSASLLAAAPQTGLPTGCYLTAAEVRGRYSISNSTLYKWIAEGRFPKPMKLGKRAARFNILDLVAFEATLTQGGK